MAKKKRKKIEPKSTIDSYFKKNETSPSTSGTGAIVVNLESNEASDSDTIISPFKDSNGTNDATISLLTPSKSEEKEDATARSKRKLFSLFEPRSKEKAAIPVLPIDVDTTDTESPARRTRSGRKSGSSKKGSKKGTPKTVKTGVECVTIDENEPSPEVSIVKDMNNGRSSPSIIRPPIKRHPPPLLWTVKYKPKVSSDLIGQSSSVLKFSTWLQNFFDNRRLLIGSSKSGRKNKVSSPSVSKRTLNGFIVEDEDSNDTGEDNTCFLIHSSVHGIGKTSLVHLIASETSSEVFEMNCSMKRSGKMVTSTLQEVTQSNRLGLRKSVGVNGNADGNNGGPMSLMNFFKPKIMLSEEEERKRRVREERRKEKEEREIRRKEKKERQQSLYPVSSINGDDSGDMGTIKAKKKRKRITIESDDDDTEIDEPIQEVLTALDVKKEPDATNKSDATLVANSKLSFTSNSFILFDDVDAIFNEEEDGFWKSVRNLIRESKVPVVFTATKMIDCIKDKLGDIEVINHRLPSPTVDDVQRHLIKICDEEKIDHSSFDLFKMINHFNCDIRRCINELQFWSGQFDYFKIDTIDIAEDSAKAYQVDSDQDTDVDTDMEDIYEDVVKTTEPYKQIHEPLYEHLTTVDQLLCKFNIYSDHGRRLKYLVQREIDPFEEVTSERTFATELVDYWDTLYQTVEKKKCSGLVDQLDKLTVDQYMESKLDMIIPKVTEAVNVQNKVNISNVSIAMDYIPFLVPICKSEEIRISELVESKRRTRRFLHYFDSINLNFDCKGSILNLYDNYLSIEYKYLTMDDGQADDGKKSAIDPTDEGLRGSSDEEEIDTFE